MITSKKHLAHLERERRQGKLIIIGAIAILAIVFLLIGYGILDMTVLQARQPVIRVNGEEGNSTEFQMRARIYRQQLINNYLQTYMFAQIYGLDPYTDQNVAPQLEEIKTSLDTPLSIGTTILTQISNNILIRQYAHENGLEVTQQEVEQTIQEALNYYPAGSPTPSQSATQISQSTLSPLQLAYITITPTNTSQPTRTPYPSPTPNPMLTATITPSDTPYSYESFQSQYQKILADYAAIGVSEDDFRRVFFEDDLYRQKVHDMIAATVPYEQEQVWARHILVSDEQTARTIREQLINRANFSDLAAQNSLDTQNSMSGGDLGWFGHGIMAAEFETVAFSLQIGEISEPVQTDLGWHIIQVLGHEVRSLSESEHQVSSDHAFDDWLQKANENPEIKIFDNWTDLVPNTPRLDDALRALQNMNSSSETPTSIP